MSKWWHMYGGEMSTGIWGAFVAGGSEKGPDEVGRTITLPNLADEGETNWEANYLGSWDHEPSEEEKDALTPERFLDD